MGIAAYFCHHDCCSMHTLFLKCNSMLYSCNSYALRLCERTCLNSGKQNGVLEYIKTTQGFQSCYISRGHLCIVATHPLISFVWVQIASKVYLMLLLVVGWRFQPVRDSRAFGSPPPMSSRHRNLEPLGGGTRQYIYNTQNTRALQPDDHVYIFQVNDLLARVQFTPGLTSSLSGTLPASNSLPTDIGTMLIVVHFVQ